MYFTVVAAPHPPCSCLCLCTCACVPVCLCLWQLPTSRLRTCCSSLQRPVVHLCKRDDLPRDSLGRLTQPPLPPPPRPDQQAHAPFPLPSRGAFSLSTRRQCKSSQCLDALVSFRSPPFQLPPTWQVLGSWSFPLRQSLAATMSRPLLEAEGISGPCSPCVIQHVRCHCVCPGRRTLRRCAAQGPAEAKCCIGRPG